MPEVVRDDALYCSTSCKLKAQRRRKKERVQRASEECSRVFEAVTPFGNVEQLSFSFVAAATPPDISTAAPKTKESSASPEPSAPSPSPKPRSWLDGLVNRLKGEPSGKGPRQRSSDDGLDIV